MRRVQNTQIGHHANMGADDQSIEPVGVAGWFFGGVGGRVQGSGFGGRVQGAGVSFSLQAVVGMARGRELSGIRYQRSGRGTGVREYDVREYGGVRCAEYAVRRHAWFDENAQSKNLNPDPRSLNPEP